MLKGDSQLNIDAKGRINVPSKFRDDLGEKFVLTKGLDGCIFVFPMEAWGGLEDKLSRLSLSQGRQIQRFFFGSMTECSIDKQGRVLIPQSLREFAGIEKDLVFVGLLDRAEIWSKTKWDEQNDSFLDDNENVVGMMEELGI